MFQIYYVKNFDYCAKLRSILYFDYLHFITVGRGYIDCLFWKCGKPIRKRKWFSSISIHNWFSLINMHNCFKNKLWIVLKSNFYYNLFTLFSYFHAFLFGFTIFSELTVHEDIKWKAAFSFICYLYIVKQNIWT